MTPCMYQCKSGQYKGMWHVRVRHKGRYFHIGRYKTLEEAQKALDKQKVPA